MQSSTEKHRQPNVPLGNYSEEEVVDLQGTKEVPSFPPARPDELTRGAKCTDLMEHVVGSENLLSALRRVEKNDGLPVSTEWRLNSFSPS